jgi:hypothetical protein
MWLFTCMKANQTMKMKVVRTIDMKTELGMMQSESN